MESASSGHTWNASLGNSGEDCMALSLGRHNEGGKTAVSNSSLFVSSKLNVHRVGVSEAQLKVLKSQSVKGEIYLSTHESVIDRTCILGRQISPFGQSNCP